MSDIASHLVILAFGSNMGNRMEALRAALQAIRPYVEITATSPIYETAPAYVTDQPAFLNAVCMGTTKIEPLTLLWTLKDIESDIGRLPTFRNGPRVIDIDIISYGTLLLLTPELILPHPRMEERDFVLRPLHDIAPQWRHPNGKTVTEMLALLPDNDMIMLDETL